MAEHFKSLLPGTVRTAGTGSGNNIWGTAGKKYWECSSGCFRLPNPVLKVNGVFLGCLTCITFIYRSGQE